MRWRYAPTETNVAPGWFGRGRQLWRTNKIAFLSIHEIHIYSNGFTLRAVEKSIRRVEVGGVWKVLVASSDGRKRRVVCSYESHVCALCEKHARIICGRSRQKLLRYRNRMMAFGWETERVRCACGEREAHAFLKLRTCLSSE